MRLHIQGRNFKITDAIQAYVTQKIGKAARHYDHIMTNIDVKLMRQPNRHPADQNLVAVTVYVNGDVLRAEEHHDDLFACIDVVADKIIRQLKKYKTKRSYHA